MKKHYRQGDILILEIEKQDVSTLTQVAPEGDSIVIAHGEATGHRHRFNPSEVQLFETPGIPDSSDRILHARALLASMKHDEHDLIPLSKDNHEGDYEVIRQRGYVAEQPSRVISD